MALASTRPDGVTAPIANGFSSQERMKCTSSSRRRFFFFSRRARICDGIVTVTQKCDDRPPQPEGLKGPGAGVKPGSGRAAQTVEELLDLGEEARGFSVRLLRGHLFELGQQLFLLLGQV